MVLASDVKKRFGLVQGVIRCIRGLRNDAAIEPVIKVDVILLSEAPQKQLLEEVQDYIRNLARVETLTITEALEQPVTQAFPGMVEMVQEAIGEAEKRRARAQGSFRQQELCRTGSERNRSKKPRRTSRT
jgi:valyl-tRNA synthetase